MLFRSSIRYLTLLTLSLFFAACGKEESSSTTSRDYMNLETSLALARVDAARLLGSKGQKYRAAWDQTPNGSRWSNLVLKTVQANRPMFESARDLEEFCPEYHSATAFQKDTCWLRILSAMARYESNFQADSTYLEKSGVTSVGLLMMSPENCKTARSITKLKNAEANLACALPRMAQLIAQDNYLSGPANRGAARYWSVLRAPYAQGKLFLGRRPHIQIFTQTYAAFPAPAQKDTL